MWNKVTEKPIPTEGECWVRTVRDIGFGSEEKEKVEYHSCTMHNQKPFLIGHHFYFDCGVITHWAEIEKIDI